MKIEPQIKITLLGLEFKNEMHFFSQDGKINTNAYFALKNKMQDRINKLTRQIMKAINYSIIL